MTKGVYLGDVVKCHRSKRAGKVVRIDDDLTLHVERAMGGEFTARYEDLEVIAPTKDRKKYREGLK